MKKMKWAILIQLLLVFSLVISGCGNEKKNSEKGNTSDNKKVEIVVTKDNGKEEVASKKIAIEKESVLYDLMKANFEIKDDNGFITSINGAEQDVDSNHYWFFEVNGENAVKGANETNVKAGDQVKWDLHEASF